MKTLVQEDRIDYKEPILKNVRMESEEPPLIAFVRVTSEFPPRTLFCHIDETNHLVGHHPVVWMSAPVNGVFPEFECQMPGEDCWWSGTFSNGPMVITKGSRIEVKIGPKYR